MFFFYVCDLFTALSHLTMVTNSYVSSLFSWCPFMSLLCILRGCSDCLFLLRPCQLIRIWVVHNCQKRQRMYFFPLNFTQVHRPFCFLPVCLCNAKCHWEYPNMSALVRFNCLASLGFERRSWMKAVLLCRFVCYTHVPFPYNRFPVYVWAFSQGQPQWAALCHWKRLR